MNILCHRGAWNISTEKNSLAAFNNSIKLNCGFESDVRDYCGKLVISHDIADENSPPMEEVLKLLKDAEDEYCFAINIKADGLTNSLKTLLQKYELKNYFAFDMSLPQMIEYRKSGLKFFTRQSEFEKVPLLYEDAAGVWLDSFESDDWLTKDLIESHLGNGKKICVVSPELHAREPQQIWEMLKEIKNPNICLCTDLFLQAKEFFK